MSTTPDADLDHHDVMWGRPVGAAKTVRPLSRRSDYFRAPAQTKLLPPTLPSEFLVRDRISSVLDASTLKPLTVIAAPAGAGKSAAVSSWIEARPQPAAWLSLDEPDSDRRRFWVLMLAALRRSEGAAPVANLEVHPREPIDMLLPEFINALEALEAPVTLVLDDLHRVSSPEIYADLDLFLRHPSTNLRLVLLTRFDPPISVERMRLAGQVGELRARELAFTLNETVELLELLGVKLALADVELLWRRSEGWAAGLRLAATTLADCATPERLVADLAGDDANIAEYLLAEVLARESPGTREFLIRAAVVDELPVELAAELTGRSDSARILAELTHRHALIAPVTDRRDVYRLHALFAEMLRAQLKLDRPAEIRTLHALAARWYARNGAPLSALRHALKADDEDFAAGLARDRWVEVLATGELSALRSLVEQLQPARFEREPELALALAARLIDAGHDSRVEHYLRLADEKAAQLPDARRQQFAVARAAVQLYRGRARGDLKMAKDGAQRLLMEGGSFPATDDGQAIRALALATLGMVEVWTGSADTARRHLERGRAVASGAQLDWIRLLCDAYLALGSAVAGRLGSSERRVLAALELAAGRGWSRTYPAAVALTALASVQLQWNLIDDAERTLQRATGGVERSHEPPLLAMHGLVRGQVLAAQGRFGEALEVFETAADKLTGWTVLAVPLGPMLETEAAMVRAALGQWADAERDLERAAAESPAPAIGLARLAIAAGDPAAARNHLSRALSDDSCLSVSMRIEGWALDAIACDALPDHASARTSLERALDAAEPGGFRRALIKHGSALRPVLRRQPRLGTAHRAFVDELLAVLDDGAVRVANHDVLPEHLTDRETAVLRFLPTMLSNQEIASELFVTVNTVKTHLRSIYRKLDARDRREAVRRARETQLLAPALVRRE